MGSQLTFSTLRRKLFGNHANFGARHSNISKKEAVPQYETSYIVPLQKSEKYFNTDQASQHINFLLNSAAALANSVQKVKIFPNAPGNSSQNASLKPFKISFACRHTYNIEFNNSSLARKYLALPVSNYSVLDSNLISKSSEKDTFSVVLPLGDIISYMSLRSKNSQSKSDSFDRLSLTVRAPVTVLPSPELGSINMSSGNIVFVPTVHWDKSKSTFQNQSTESKLDYRSFNISSILPRWLVWGGDFEGDDNDTGEEVPTMPASAERSRRESSICLPPLKSSIQAGFKLILKWDTEADEKLDSLADSLDMAELLPLPQTIYDTEYSESNEKAELDDINLVERFQHTRTKTLIGIESRFTERNRRRSKSKALSPTVLFAIALMKKLVRDAAKLAMRTVAMLVRRSRIGERINFNQVFESLNISAVHCAEWMDKNFSQSYLWRIQQGATIKNIVTKFHVLRAYLLIKFRRMVLRYYVLQVIPYIVVMRSRSVLLGKHFAMDAKKRLSFHYSLHGVANRLFNASPFQVLLNNDAFVMPKNTFRDVRSEVYMHVNVISRLFQLKSADFCNSRIGRKCGQFWSSILRNIYFPVTGKAAKYVSDVWDDINRGMHIDLESS